MAVQSNWNCTAEGLQTTHACVPLGASGSSLPAREFLFSSRGAPIALLLLLEPRDPAAHCFLNVLPLGTHLRFIVIAPIIMNSFCARVCVISTWDCCFFFVIHISKWALKALSVSTSPRQGSKGEACEELGACTIPHVAGRLLLAGDQPPALQD